MIIILKFIWINMKKYLWIFKNKNMEGVLILLASEAKLIIVKLH